MKKDDKAEYHAPRPASGGQFRLFVVAFVALAFLSACSSSCTEDDLKAKTEEIQQKMQNLATSGDINKMMQVAGKIREIASAAQGQDGDLQAACEMADEILDELN